jgi:hypothetical protein
VIHSHLVCQEIVLRAIRNKGWIDQDGKLNASAFIRDPLRDPDGLSVNLRSQTDLNHWLISTFNKSFGADTLHVGYVRKLELEVGQTQEDFDTQSGHALIVGIPTQDEDPKRAEDIATELVKMSRQFDRNVRQRPK